MVRAVQRHCSEGVCSQEGRAIALRFLELHPSTVHELRVPNMPAKRGRPFTVSGFFDDPEKLVAAAMALDRQGAPAVYITLNQLSRDSLALANNRVERYATKTTSDKDVLRRLLLFIDVDPERMSGISSTDDEKREALHVADDVMDECERLEWPDPLFIDSGNGYHVLFAIDEPPDDGGLVERVLDCFDQMFSTERAKIDTSVHNAARITKLPGTMSRKGDETSDRMHRRSAIVNDPGVLKVVPHEKLVDFAGAPPASNGTKPARKQADYHEGSGDRDALERLVARLGLAVRDIRVIDTGLVARLQACPWDPSHTDGDAWVILHGNRKITAGCYHNSCQGKTYEDIRKPDEPQAEVLQIPIDHYDREYGVPEHEEIPIDPARDVPIDGLLKRLVSAEDILDPAKNPLPEDVIGEQLVPVGSWGLIAAKPGMGKSFLACQLMIAAATGQHWMGIPVAHAPSIYVGPELWRGYLSRRLVTIRKEADCGELDAPFKGFYVLPRAEKGGEPDLLDEGFTTQLIYAATTVGAKIVIIDPLSRVLDGDDTDTSAVRTTIAFIEKIAREAECAVLAIHHERKSGTDAKGKGGGQSRGDDMDSIRGHSMWSSHPNAVWRLHERSKSDGSILFTCAKANFGKRPPHRVLTQNDDGVLIPQEDDLLQAPRQDARFWTANRRAVFEWLQSAGPEGLRRAQIVRQLSHLIARRDSVYNAIRDLSEAGHLVVEGDLVRVSK